MTTTSEQVRAWKGPTILSYGYRPFFLLAGIWAAFAMLVWILILTGNFKLPTRFDPVSWHAHEVLFGYLPAVAAGFLLTAVPNWTGRLPIVGWRLGGLVALWIAGRLAVMLSALIPALAAAVIDLSFLTVFALAIGREIVAGRNWRNLMVLGLLTLLLFASALFHWEAAQGGTAASGYGLRLGLAAGVTFISLIGGRIVPSFTRNWLAKQGSKARPAPLNRLDTLTLAGTFIALVVWVLLPDHPISALLNLLAGAANVLRLSRWSGLHTLSEPLVWILHVGFAFIPLGFLTLGLSGLIPSFDAAVEAQHLWMAGAIGVMTLAVMTRASLGHAGRPLAATPAITLLYVALIISVVTRFLAAFLDGQDWIIHLSATGWILAFTGFAIIYWPILTRPRPAKS